MNLSIWKIFLLAGSTLGLSVHAEIENTGFLGGPFHGVSRDATGSVVNRVGPVADLVETIGLATHSTSRNLEDGDRDVDVRGALTAHAILDDALAG